MLLPLSENLSRDISLANHLAFAACRASAGNYHLVNELIRLVYLTFFVQEAGYGETDPMVYAQAEVALVQCISRANSDKKWLLDSEDAGLFEAILCQADWQLEHAPRHYLIEARERLNRFALTTRISPLPHSTIM